jgi:hypothetical protein
VAETQGRRQLGQIMFARFNEATAWVQPEVLRVGEMERILEEKAGD